MFFADTPSSDNSVWSQNLESLRPLIEKKDYRNLIDEAKRLSREAAAQQGLLTIVLPLETIAIDANAILSGEDEPALARRISDNFQLAMKTARREGISTEADRVRNEDLIFRKLDDLEKDIDDLKGANAGFKVFWNKLVGGVDLTEINEQWVEILREILTTPLTSEGKDRLLSRHKTIMKQLDIQVWKVIGGGTFAFLVLALLKSQLSTLWSLGLSTVTGRAKSAISTKVKKVVTRRFESLKDDLKDGNNQPIKRPRRKRKRL